jgi:hypothetical protein
MHHPIAAKPIDTACGTRSAMCRMTYSIPLVAQATPSDAPAHTGAHITLSTRTERGVRKTRSSLARLTAFSISG